MAKGPARRKAVTAKPRSEEDEAKAARSPPEEAARRSRPRAQERGGKPAKKAAKPKKKEAVMPELHEIVVRPW